MLLVFATSTAIVDAQEETGFFNGNGMKGVFGGSDAGQSKSSTGTFGFHRGAKIAEIDEKPGFQFPKWEMPKLKVPKFQMPKLFDRNNFPNPVQLSDSEGGLFSNFPKIELPTRDRSQPNFFQRMNERTKELFGRTKDGINNTASNVLGADPSARQSWDSITKGLNGDIGGSGNRNQPPIQPRLRSARSTDGSTTKF